MTEVAEGIDLVGALGEFVLNCHELHDIPRQVDLSVLHGLEGVVYCKLETTSAGSAAIERESVEETI